MRLFFTEAIFLVIYIYGWKRLGGWAHFWSGVPMVVTGVGGAFSVVTANSWMNQPQGFAFDAAGRVVDAEPLEVLFNPAWHYEVPHMILAAYMGRRLPRRLDLRGREAARAARQVTPARAADPADRGGDRDACPDLRRRRRGRRRRCGALGGRGPAGQVRRLRVHPGDRTRPSTSAASAPKTVSRA